MYNAEQKERFIKDFTDSISVRKAAVRVFKMTERYEKEIGSDVVTVDLNTLQRIFDNIAGVRDKSKHMPRYVLREYSKWALENGVPDASDAALKLENTGTDKLKEVTVRNPKQLQYFLNQICLPESEETADNNIRSWCWLGYSGMDDVDSITVKTHEINFSSMVISHNGFLYPIYREAVPALKYCVTLSQFRYVHPNYNTDVVYRDRSLGDELLRGYRGSPALSTLRVELSKRGKRLLDDGKTNLHLSYYRIWLSGVFYRMYEDELAGIPISFDDITNRKLGDKQFKLDSGRNTQEYKRLEISRNFYTDYERWKQTFI